MPFAPIRPVFNKHALKLVIHLISLFSIMFSIMSKPLKDPSTYLSCLQPSLYDLPFQSFSPYQKATKGGQTDRPPNSIGSFVFGPKNDKEVFEKL